MAELMLYNREPLWRKRLLISTCTEGMVRYEWAHARFGQVIPVNWEASGYDVFVTFDYSIDDAYNLITKHALDIGVDWVLMIEDDCILPPDCFVRIGQHMDDPQSPVVSGLYYTKSEPAQPLVFRGRGTGPYRHWKLGEQVWCDGLPMGCLLIHTDLLRWAWDKSPTYKVADGAQVRRVFETPRRVFLDPEKGIQKQEGTQDLFFFDRLLEGDALKETGWKKVARRKYPFICDTGIFCWHIDRNTGKKYPGAI